MKKATKMVRKVVKKIKSKKPQRGVEDVFSGRNIIGFVADPEQSSRKESVPLHLSEKARDFDIIFKAATEEILELTNSPTNLKMEEFVKNSGLTNTKMHEISKAESGSVFQIGNEFYVKTVANQLESVPRYCTRLEQALLTQIKLKDTEKLEHEQHVELETQKFLKYQQKTASDLNALTLRVVSLDAVVETQESKWNTLLDHKNMDIQKLKMKLAEYEEVPNFIWQFMFFCVNLKYKLIGVFKNG